jgi:hypothetical protein
MEWGRPQGSNYSAADWARIALEATRRCVERYQATRA